MSAPPERVDAFIVAAAAPLDGSHASGTLDRAAAILAEHPAVASANIYTAALLGDAEAVVRFLAGDPALARAKGGPHAWDALTHLCFSRYLRLHPTRSDGFVRAAAALLDAGADIEAGFSDVGHLPEPEWESLLYGAAGVAHHAGVTRLLLARGADPNDAETPYHAPETDDNAALQVLLESGRLTQDSLATLLLRKHDWHDLDGIRRCLAHGADPNRNTPFGRTPLFHAVQRDNDLELVEAGLDHGGDPARGSAALSTTALAARRGRGDLLALFERHGFSVALDGLDGLLAACARDDEAAIRASLAREPALRERLATEGGPFLVEFAGVGNLAGVGRLLDLGVPIDAPHPTGDGYYDLAEQATALHSAAWRAHHQVVGLLIDRGAAVDRLDGRGRTPLALAVIACVDSYWTGRRAPDSVAALLAAGADPASASFPSGYQAIDRLVTGR